MTIDPEKLTRALARTKCKLGQGAAQCMYLVNDPNGEFACAFVNDIAREAMKANASVLFAKGGGCLDPYDPFSTTR